MSPTVAQPDSVTPGTSSTGRNDGTRRDTGCPRGGGHRAEPKERDIHGAKNRVHDAMNTVLISIGTRSDGLEAETLEVAARIGPVEVDHGATGCKTPTASTYIAKSQARQRKKEARVRA